MKQFMEAVKQGKMDAFYSDKFQAVAHLRSLKEIEEEMKRKAVGSIGLYGRGMSDGAGRLLCGPALGLPPRSSQREGTRGRDSQQAGKAGVGCANRKIGLPFPSILKP